jgi:hypothetical protein
LRAAALMHLVPWSTEKNPLQSWQSHTWLKYYQLSLEPKVYHYDKSLPFNSKPAQFCEYILSLDLQDQFSYWFNLYASIS